MSLGEAGNSAFDFVFTESIAGGYALLDFKDMDWSDPRYAERDEIFEAVQRDFPSDDLTPNKGSVQSPDVFRNQLQVGDVLVAAKGNRKYRAIGIVEGEYEYAPRPGGAYCHRRKVRRLWSDPEGRDIAEIYPPRFIQNRFYRLKNAELDRPALAELITAGAAASRPVIAPPHVVIIDEINRANISKVFGELITLLEPDKRLGMSNALTVRLP
jgi:5-methylcytosine-specific restriction protein B